MRGRLGSELVEISAFAELTGLSVDALRHYHDLGVLVPAEVVPTSRYRRYHLDQVGRARQIAFLRSVDMPLPASGSCSTQAPTATRCGSCWSTAARSPSGRAAPPTSSTVWTTT